MAGSSPLARPSPRAPGRLEAWQQQVVALDPRRQLPRPAPAAPGSAPCAASPVARDAGSGQAPLQGDLQQGFELDFVFFANARDSTHRSIPLLNGPAGYRRSRGSRPPSVLPPSSNSKRWMRRAAACAALRRPGCAARTGGRALRPGPAPGAARAAGCGCSTTNASSMEWVTNSRVKRTSSPQAQQFFLHLSPGQRVQRGERPRPSAGSSAASPAPGRSPPAPSCPWTACAGRPRRSPPGRPFSRHSSARSLGLVARHLAGHPQGEQHVLPYGLPWRQLVELLNTTIRSGPAP